MILKLIVIMYAWAWNTAPWQPATNNDWGLVIAGGFFLDVPALILTAFFIHTMIDAIGRRG